MRDSAAWLRTFCVGVRVSLLASNPSPPIRIQQNQSPAPRCTPPASNRRCFRPPATSARGLQPGDFGFGQIWAKPEGALAVVIGRSQNERIAPVVVPDLDSIDAMPMRALAAG